MNCNDPDGAVVTWVDRPPRPGPLKGLRIGIKDLIAVQGVPRLCGAPGMVAASPQPSDATVVARLVAAGGHIVATTATHPFGWGVTTPSTKNPRAPGRIAGGSSGGSAAALAAGLIDGALGTDTAGSIRIPAACCGVVGLRTSEGLLPRDGVQPLAPTLDVVGPLARDVGTVATLLAALTGNPIRPTRLTQLRVGLIDSELLAPLDCDVRRAWAGIVASLRSEGARVTAVAVPNLHGVRQAAALILAAEEGMVHHETLEAYGAELSPGVRRALQGARELSNDEVLVARREVAVFRHQVDAVFRSVDVLVLPVLPCRVPPVGAETVTVDGVSERFGSALTRLNIPWSSAGLPAGAVPIDSDADAGPIGMQVVGARRNEATVLGAMALLERLAGGPWPPVARR